MKSALRMTRLDTLLAEIAERYREAKPHDGRADNDAWAIRDIPRLLNALACERAHSAWLRTRPENTKKISDQHEIDMTAILEDQSNANNEPGMMTVCATAAQPAKGAKEGQPRCWCSEPSNARNGAIALKP